MESTQTGAGDGSRAGHQYRLVVAVANPAHVEQLMRTAIDLANDRGGLIQVVSVVHKPVTSPFHLFSEQRIKAEFADAENAVLDEAVSVAAGTDVPVEGTLLVGTDISEVILSVVDDAGADALLLGWQNRPRPADVVLGTTVDPVITRAPCDVFVERIGTTADGMESILVPTDGGPHIEAAVELAGAVARSNAATVEVVSYVTPDAATTEHDRAHEHVETATTRISGVSVDGIVREVDSVTDAIVYASDDHDFLVMGATRERRLRGRAVGSVATAVGRRTSIPIVIAKRGSADSFLERALAYWL